MIDIAVVGGGPAGLAAAIACARRGLSVELLERRAFPCDKACGEGLLPPALRALEQLGVRSAIPAAASAPLLSLRYVQEDGSAAEARLPDGGGLGVRRTVLSEVLRHRAAQEGVVLRERARVIAHRREPDSMALALEGGEALRCRLLVAADGLASPLREAEGLGVPVSDPRRRFGATRHYPLKPWSAGVEVHLAEGAEAYVTPLAPEEIGVAVLWTDSAERVSYDRLLTRFGALSDRLAGAGLAAGLAAEGSAVRGAGPLERRARRLIADRFVLLGDAAGYHDAISGEGLALAFLAAVTLAEVAPEALQSGATRDSLRPYERACGRRFRKYQAVSRAMLAVARRPVLRGAAVTALHFSPALFDRLVRFGLV